MTWLDIPVCQHSSGTRPLPPPSIGGIQKEEEEEKGAGNSQVKLSMKLRVSKVLADVRKEDLHFFPLPPQDLRQEAHRHALQSFFKRHEIERADCLLLRHALAPPLYSKRASWGRDEFRELYQMLILGPRSNRQRKMLMMDVDKPRLLHPPLNLRARRVILAKGIAGR